MDWFDWLRIVLGVPAAIAVIGLFTVLVNDIKYNR